MERNIKKEDALINKITNCIKKLSITFILGIFISVFQTGCQIEESKLPSPTIISNARPTETPLNPLNINVCNGVSNFKWGASFTINSQWIYYFRGENLYRRNIKSQKEDNMGIKCKKSVNPMLYCTEEELYLIDENGEKVYIINESRKKLIYNAKKNAYTGLYESVTGMNIYNGSIYFICVPNELCYFDSDKNELIPITTFNGNGAFLDKYFYYKQRKGNGLYSVNISDQNYKTQLIRKGISEYGDVFVRDSELYYFDGGSLYKYMRRTNDTLMTSIEGYQIYGDDAYYFIKFMKDMPDKFVRLDWETMKYEDCNIEIDNIFPLIPIDYSNGFVLCNYFYYKESNIDTNTPGSSLDFYLYKRIEK